MTTTTEATRVTKADVTEARREVARCTKNATYWWEQAGKRRWYIGTKKVTTATGFHHESEYRTPSPEERLDAYDQAQRWAARAGKANYRLASVMHAYMEQVKAERQEQLERLGDSA